MKSLELLPAVDIKSGQAARLKQAIMESIENYGDPQEVVTQFINAGCKWIHLVDLDLAFNSGDNSKSITEIIAKNPIAFQISGGIKAKADFDNAFATSAQRINLATSALSNLNWVGKIVAEHGERISISLDVKENDLVARGSGENLGSLSAMLEKLNNLGCTRYVVTDVESDGALSGPNFDLLKKVADSTNALIIASGGVSTVDDLQKLRQLNLDGVIVGKALYSGQIDLQLALSACYK